MKKLALIIISITATLNGFAQFRLSGRVLNEASAGADTLTINLPYVYGYNPDGDIRLPLNRQGQFSTTLPIAEKRLATLSYKGKKHFLLLSPGKNLTLLLNAADTALSSLVGTASAENRLLQRLSILQLPFFRQGGSNNRYITLSPEIIQEQVVKLWLALRDQQLAMIGNTQGLSKEDKLLIGQEVKANAITQLSAFARSDVRMKRNDLQYFLITLYKDVSVKPDVLPAGPLYYELADNYVGYLEAATAKEFQQKGSDPKMTMPYYGISLDSANHLVSEKGKMYMNWLAIKRNFDPRVAEAMLAQAIAAKCQEKQLTEVRPLMQEFRSLYPRSRYMADLEAKTNDLNASLAVNKKNEAIQVFSGYQQISSIYQVINQYKGKVVYLDIWGTWCAPCRYELGFTPQLKQHFKDKDVVFIYLDMDDNSKDAHWREFLQVNNLTGLHLRKSSEDIQQIWEEVQPLKDRQGMYPSYFIFDKSGKLVPEAAKRPNEKTELYKQIEKYL